MASKATRARNLREFDPTGWTPSGPSDSDGVFHQYTREIPTGGWLNYWPTTKRWYNTATGASGKNNVGAELERIFGGGS